MVIRSPGRTLEGVMVTVWKNGARFLTVIGALVEAESLPASVTMTVMVYVSCGVPPGMSSA